eukprot:1631638-Pyramimonas_sp.AAC.1
MDSGVLQGCPLSGSLYVIAANSFLLDIEVSLNNGSSSLGAARACADDLGAVIRKNRGYSRLARVFRNARLFANLVLKPAKCFVIPLRGPAREPYTSELRQILIDADAEWADFQMVDVCTYLGFQIGPGATVDAQWSEALAKHASRTVELSRQGAPVQVAAKLHADRALPVLGYISQLVPLGWKECQRQRHLVARILRAPSSMLRMGDCFALAEWGGP